MPCSWAFLFWFCKPQAALPLALKRRNTEAEGGLRMSLLYCLSEISHVIVVIHHIYGFRTSKGAHTACDQKSVRCQNTVARCVCCTVYLVVKLMIRHVLSCQWNQESSKFSFSLYYLVIFLDSPWCMVIFLDSPWWPANHAFAQKQHMPSFIPSESARASMPYVHAGHSLVATYGLGYRASVHACKRIVLLVSLYSY
jgi:hypothetical protein